MMADKYEVDIAMRFGSPTDALELRKAIEGPLGAGLTTVGDTYRVRVVEATGECQVDAGLRFADKKMRDKLVTAAKDQKVKAKPGAGGRIATHTCRHDPGDHGFDSCADLVAEEWGDRP